MSDVNKKAKYEARLASLEQDKAAAEAKVQRFADKIAAVKALLAAQG